jgi:hypothetical protein
MSEDTIARLLGAIEEHSSKHRTLSVQDWVAVVTLSIVIMGIGITAITRPIVSSLDDQKIIIKETVHSLNETKIEVARYHGKREP